MSLNVTRDVVVEPSSGTTSTKLKCDLVMGSGTPESGVGDGTIRYLYFASDDALANQWRVGITSAGKFRVERYDGSSAWVNKFELE